MARVCLFRKRSKRPKSSTADAAAIMIIRSGPVLLPLSVAALGEVFEGTTVGVVVGLAMGAAVSTAFGTVFRA